MNLVGFIRGCAALLALLSLSEWVGVEADNSKKGDGSLSSSTSITVIFPKNLMKKDTDEFEIKNHTAALFGTTDFNAAALAADIVFDSSVSEGNCIVKKQSSSLNKNILLVDPRNTCDYESIVYSAQMNGFGGLLVMNPKCLENTDEMSSEKWKTHCNDVGKSSELDHLGGMGRRISIPSFIIPRVEGTKLMECYNNANGGDTDGNLLVIEECKQPPRLQLEWRLPQKSKLEWTLWRTSLLNADLFVSSDWVEYVIPKLLSVSEFTPKYFLLNGETEKCTGKDRLPHCKNACTNEGRYCSMVASAMSGRISGQRVTQENLRQHCAFKHVQNNIDGQKKWWKYISLVASECTGKYDHDSYFTEHCSKEQHSKAGLNFDHTLKCISDGGGYEFESKDNTDLKEELLENEVYRTDMERLPMFVANDAIVEFELNLRNVIGAVCSSFVQDNNEPEFCSCFRQLTSSSSFVADKELAQICFDYPDEKSPSFVSVKTFAFVLFLMIVAFAGIQVYLKNRFRGLMNENVRNIIGEYVRMDEHEATDTSRSYHHADDSQLVHEYEPVHVSNSTHEV